jgi:hypothetical protein
MCKGESSQLKMQNKRLKIAGAVKNTETPGHKAGNENNSRR